MRSILINIIFFITFLEAQEKVRSTMPQPQVVAAAQPQQIVGMPASKDDTTSSAAPVEASVQKPLNIEDMQVLIAYSYLETKEYKKAFPLLVKHARRKDAKIDYTLGQIFENGWGTPVNYRQARGYYLKAGQAHYAQAWNRLGILLLEGLGGSRDKKSAQSAFEKGCKAKDQKSCWQLALLQNTEGLDPKAPDDPEIAVYLFEKGDYETAIPALTQMIDSPKALEALGRAYHFGWGVKKDFALAHQHYTKAWSMKNAAASFGLARLYAQGEGVARDKAVADYYFEQACQAGHTPSCQIRYGCRR